VAHSRQKALLTLEKAGHEIASHSFHHYSALSLEAKEFEQELIQSLAALQFLEQRPLGYRSPHLLMKENHYSLLHAYGFRYSSSQWGRLSTPYEIRPQLFERPVHFMDCHYLGKKAQMLSAFQDSLVAGSIHALHPYIALHPLYEKALFSLIKAQTLPLISIREQNEGKSGIALSFDIGF
jgi:hypothetical protein